MDFRSFAGSLLQSTAASQAAPLFYSTRADLAAHRAADSHDDILGVSDESLHAPAQSALDRRFPLDASDLATDDTASRSAARSTAPGAVASHLSAIPAFVSRIGRAPARVSRGWKAYESVAAYSTRGRRGGAYSDSEDDEDEERTDEEDEGPLPGAFVSQPAVDDEPHAMNEPLVGRRTLFVYPVPGPGGGANSKERYQDSVWIVAYGVALLATLALGLQAWWSAPPLPVGAPSASVLSTLPTLSLLALISVVAGVATLAYILTIQRSLATLMTLSIFGGPLLFCATGIVAFAGSFSRSGVASDAGWTTGVRWFAVLCFVLAFFLGRTALSRRKELNRAISVGELACQTVLSHPALVLMALSLSLISAIVTLPFVSIIASLLAHGPQSPSLASWGTALTVLVFFWTLAIGRGLSHAIVGGCVGTWYFEREGDEYQGPLEVTKASIVRATGPLLGTVIAASFFLAVFESLATVLHAIRRALQSSRLPSYLRPLTALAPVFAALAGYAAFFNSYALSYAGMTGEPYWSSSRETAALFTANRARNIRDTALLRLTLFVSSTGWGLLAGLLAFFLSSSQLDARSGGYAPTLALLSYAIPMYTVKLCHNVISDAVDALFVCTHLDAENQLSHCPKAVEAFGTPEAESLGSFV
ncbi:choline transporter-like family protein [Rhodotorula paludigena]|uniref:choline transporter-like family protein n=1 Tax=Rhodotorula paludigena TaxID=86838 RepID=UPI00317F6699